ncbi:STAS domain-containing protein [Umezawaea beigongshangensis]|uniref:STAS domain-containing protein n=1 Tax=Umezawaea beigongshangensis TaxID=2780383 RepID=UPI0018F1C853|nr:STAS domain-containing protein [Umezawaea beigongshangensis]
MRPDSSAPVLAVSVDDESGVVIVSMRGELDLATEHVARRPLLAAVDRAAVVADLSGLAFFSSAGIGVLVVASERAAATDTALHVVVTPRIERVLTAVGLQHHLHLHRTREDALAAVRGRG